ncbi:TldD/PmbA family protein [Beggiatoa leptomitoformis]|uniref:TldE/PmbA family protein n=1 Tax=Beggiatoa leptomitoformis TaxID=288004 RepID=A0A2N9YAV5_9GAMM|nr:metallopeptidase TldD-related protein [Beggiatoa leptomitoformis]ALG67016.1 TldE/PmbA family protein [Beggiatoa leptomitoformis]AUI67607.1 TldE/PmbA family protein [Beggiatoa leptomitoformis]
MQTYFYALADTIEKQLQTGETYLCTYEGEDSDFIRFNQGKIRQAGNVKQAYLSLSLVQGQRTSQTNITLSNDLAIDSAHLSETLAQLRQQLPHTPEDPYQLYSTTVHNSEHLANNTLPRTNDALDTILSTVQGLDFVGIYASGGIFRGFANSLGQRNWHSSYSFNTDWSCYHNQDKAVKSAYAGFIWDNATFAKKMETVKQQLHRLSYPARTIPRGEYRVYLSPTALSSIMQVLCWGGFGAKSQRTKHSPLQRLIDNPMEYRLHAGLTLTENTASGIAPDFQNAGFIKPAQVPLIKAGKFAQSLVSPRSAKQYHLPANGANDEEMPLSLEMQAGNFPQAYVLKALDTGIYINNLWYLNYSDRPAGRITGMTRFATFWVENGEIVAPLNVMRFDETIYNLLGKQLIALTIERELIIDADTYDKRANSTMCLAGALVEGVRFTL